MGPSEAAVLHVTQSHTITGLQKLNRHLMEVIDQLHSLAAVPSFLNG
jgi:hypothetical protein